MPIQNNIWLILSEYDNLSYITENRFMLYSILAVVLDGEVLAAHHPVALEPLAAELLGCPLGSVGPFHSDAVVVDVFGGVVERVAG